MQYTSLEPGPTGNRGAVQNRALRGLEVDSDDQGVRPCTVSGDPNANGSAFVIRMRCADGTKVPAHGHPTDENVTVLKGTFLAGMGKAFDETKLSTMNVGNFISMPKEMRHFARCKGETIVQVHGVGPFKVNWGEPGGCCSPRRTGRGRCKNEIVVDVGCDQSSRSLSERIWLHRRGADLKPRLRLCVRLKVAVAQSL
jgi:quercetin dioxygenase-like cupin family protein